MKKVVRDLGPDYDSFELVSFHSTSKGIIGECGRRGGYMELCGFDSKVLGLGFGVWGLGFGRGGYAELCGFDRKALAQAQE